MIYRQVTYPLQHFMIIAAKIHDLHRYCVVVGGQDLVIIDQLSVMQSRPHDVQAPL